MLPAEIDKVAEADLRALVSSNTAESQTLDFKRDLPGRDAANRHDFCSDICAFANASGGDLLYGVDEDKEGRAHAIVPITANSDEEQLRLQDVALNGLEPRVTGVHVRAVQVGDGYVFLVRVPKSLIGPHRVKTNQHFYLREGARKRQLDMPEIRSVFARAEGMAEKLRQFRLERVSKILSGDAPVRLPAAPLCVMHILPLQPAEGALPIDPRLYSTTRMLPVIRDGARNSRPNLDGALANATVNDESYAYTLLFRDGQVEAVLAFMTKREDGKFNIPSSAYERLLISFYDSMLTELRHLKLAPPHVVFFSLLRASIAHFGVGSMESFLSLTGQGHFDRDVLLYPDVVVETADAGLVALRPVFDLVWQSVGFDASRNFDDKGQWVNRN